MPVMIKDSVKRGKKTYFMSDVHGCLGAFKKVLTRIRFNKKADRLIIIGDIFDRNPYGMEVLWFIKPYLQDGSMVLIKGNHELFAQMYLEGRLTESLWTTYGGGTMVQSIKKMPQNDREELLLFLKSLPHYIEMQDTKYGEFIVTHTGIHCDYYVYGQDGRIDVARSIKRAVEENEYMYLISMDIHHIPFSDLKKLDKYIICGHVYTSSLQEDGTDRIYRTPYYMDIDCGAGHGGKLACYCLDTDEAIYMS